MRRYIRAAFVRRIVECHTRRHPVRLMRPSDARCVQAGAWTHVLTRAGDWETESRRASAPVPRSRTRHVGRHLQPRSNRPYFPKLQRRFLAGQPPLIPWHPASAGRSKRFHDNLLFDEGRLIVHLAEWAIFDPTPPLVTFHRQRLVAANLSHSGVDSSLVLSQG
jgi:hypothetical protein